MNPGQLLDQLVAERDIQRVIHRYAQTLDTGDYEGFADCFTDDGEYESTRNGVMARGRAELVDFASRYDHAPAVYQKHVVVDSVITLGDGEAEVQSYYLFIQDRSTGPFIASYGTYKDHVVRGGDGRWRIARRLIQSEAMNPDGVHTVRPKA